MAKAKAKKEQKDEGQSEKLLDVQRKYPRSRGKQVRRDDSVAQVTADQQRREPAAKLVKRKGDRPSGDEEGQVPARKIAGPALVGTVAYQGRCKLNPHGDTSYSGRARK